MAETRYLRLSANDRRAALEVAAGRSGRSAHLLEKDVWVVEALRGLFGAPFGGDLAFKGGTSLAKAYGAIRRFSEDIDITYDIRALAPELTAGAGEDALPPTRSQERRWTREIRARLAAWVSDRARSVLEESLAGSGSEARIRAEGDRLHVVYEPLFGPRGFVRPEVMVEFGARSTGEPREVRPVSCDAAEYLPELAFPEASPSVLLAERTFWEKATAIHVFCLQERRRGERLSRHWHDLVRLDDAGIAARALSDRALAFAVAHHKAAFFPEKDAAGGRIDYKAAVSGGLRLVPDGPAREVLADDYRRMTEDGMLLDDGERFEEIMQRCAGIEDQANRMREDDRSPS